MVVDIATMTTYPNTPMIIKYSFSSYIDKEGYDFKIS